MNAKIKLSKKAAKQRKALVKRLIRDTEELVDLLIDRGAMSSEAMGEMLGEVAQALARTHQQHGPEKSLRKGERFLSHLHEQHGKKIGDHQLQDEEHDQRELLRIVHMTEAGETPVGIARKLRAEGTQITADGIRRILAIEVVAA